MMMRIASLLLLAAVACAGEEATAQAEVVPDDAPQEYVSDSVKLTKDNFGQITSNRTVFIKFYASWCEYCTAMEDDWEKIASEWKDHPTALVGQVDCDADDALKLCEEYRIETLPTILYGDVTVAEFYEGERTYDEMSAFAKGFISKPNCDVFTLENCDDEAKAVLETLNKKPVEELTEMFEAVKKYVDEKNEEFNKKVEALEEEFEKIGKEMDEDDERYNATVEPLVDEYSALEDALIEEVEAYKKEKNQKWVQKLILEHNKLVSKMVDEAMGGQEGDDSSAAEADDSAKEEL